ncbi:MAG: HlyD family efflux transporter periplasmic adaptor subunit [Chloroflexota bacterium]|nr:HlyD family efflux transporter periplasmic adaptor subunit [Chloroflexota bacterium]
MLVFITAGCSGGSTLAPPTFAPPPTAVPLSNTTYTVGQTTVQETIEARGRVTARKETPLVFPMEGTLKAIHAYVGDEITPGTVLAELDAPELQQQSLDRKFDLNTAEVTLSRAKTESNYAVARAQAQYSRAQATYDQAVLNGEMAVVAVQQAAENDACGSLCGVKLEQAQSGAEIAARIAGAEMETARIAVLEAQTNRDYQTQLAEERVALARERYLMASEAISKTQLVAPFAGTLIAFNKQVGDPVEAYATIGTLADPSELYVVVNIAADRVQRLSVGMPVVIRLDATSDQPYTGTVQQIGTQPTLGQNTYEAIVNFDPDQEIPAAIQMRADVLITGQTHENVLVVPNRALHTFADWTYVEVVGANNSVEQVEVKTGITDGSITEIVDGVQLDQVLLLP